MLSTIITILIIIASILLVLVVLIQNSKGGGLDSSFGNANQLGGVASSTETIEKATWTLAGTVAGLSLLMFAVGGGSSAVQSVETNIKGQSAPIRTVPQQQTPAAPVNNSPMQNPPAAPAN